MFIVKNTKTIGNILNDNERFSSTTSLNNVIDETTVERIADMLLRKLGYPESRPYYCKVARLLPESTLERLADKAKELGRHTGKLFTYLTKQEIRKLGVRHEE